MPGVEGEGSMRRQLQTHPCPVLASRHNPCPTLQPAPATSQPDVVSISPGRDPALGIWMSIYTYLQIDISTHLDIQIQLHMRRSGHMAGAGHQLLRSHGRCSAGRDSDNSDVL